MVETPFDTLAGEYDKWFDSPRGQAIFALETACLRGLIGRVDGRWIEIGVGTGRFAEALGIPEGVDPSAAALEFAAGRGIRTEKGRGEALPYPDAVFDGALMVVTICFLDDPPAALGECRRILKEKGRLIMGLVPAESPWGRDYARKAGKGHRFYSAAKFYTCDDISRLAAEAGFTPGGARSCLFSPPDRPIVQEPPRKAIVENAGFVAMEFAKT